MMDEKALLKNMEEAVIRGDGDEAADLARTALSGGMDVNQILDEGFIKGIERVGRLWEDGEYFLPELVRGAEAMKAALAVIEPVILEKGKDRKKLGKVVIGTIEGDIHDIGKTLVAAMLTAYGFDVVDLGADVPIGRFVDTAKESGADLVCMSALLTTTMVGQKKVIDQLKEQGLPAKVIVGGAPVSQSWADEIGADGYGESAVAAVEIAKRLVA